MCIWLKPTSVVKKMQIVHLNYKMLDLNHLALPWRGSSNTDSFVYLLLVLRRTST